MTEVTIEQVYKELKALRTAVEAMKEEIEDRLLTSEEEVLVEKALQEHREGKTTSLEDLKRELGQ
jgi:hypothetical protein